MTNYEQALKRTTATISLYIFSFIEQAELRNDKAPCEALNDLTIGIIAEIKEHRRRLAKQAEGCIKVLQEVEG